MRRVRLLRGETAQQRATEADVHRRNGGERAVAPEPGCECERPDDGSGVHNLVRSAFRPHCTRSSLQD